MTQQIDSILVPINDSVYAKRAFELAKKFKGEELELFHEVPRWAPYIEDILFPYAGLGEDKVAIELEILKNARRFLEKKLKFSSKIKFDIGFSTEDSTRRKLQESPADLVVVGGAKFRSHLGPYGEKLMMLPIKPTLFVKEKATISKILVAIDLSPHSAKILNFAAQIAVQMDAEMETLVVIPDGNDDVRELLQLNVSVNRKKLIGKSRSRIEAMFERTLQAQDLKFGTFDLLSPKLKRKKILVGEPAHIISTYAERSEVDLLIIGSSRESVQLGPVARQVLHSTMINTCVVNT